MRNYDEQKINILLNFLYTIMFNSIELAFGNIKKFLYSKTYFNIEKFIEETLKVLEDDKFSSLIFIFKETL